MMFGFPSGAQDLAQAVGTLEPMQPRSCVLVPAELPYMPRWCEEQVNKSSPPPAPFLTVPRCNHVNLMPAKTRVADVCSVREPREHTTAHTSEGPRTALEKNSGVFIHFTRKHWSSSTLKQDMAKHALIPQGSFQPCDGM